MKQVIKSFLLVCLVCALCPVFSGCVLTAILIEFSSNCDPPIQTYHAAYMHKGDIVLEYSVVDRSPLFRGEHRFADRYWARLDLDKIDKVKDRPTKPYSIHRRPLSSWRKKRMTPIPIVDLRKQIPADESGQIADQDLQAFFKQQPINTLPQVFVCMDRKRKLFVCYMDKDSDKVKVYNVDPIESFFHVSRYPLLAVIPLAAVADIVVSPVIFTIWHLKYPNGWSL